MRVLVTGGSGVVGEAAVRALLRRGHAVRLLARGAEKEARTWPDGVEPWKGDVTDADSLRGAADGCDAVLHLVGIVDEKPPHATFEGVNVAGTRHVVAETTRAGVPHLVYVSSLGAERGRSPYHRSKHAGEEVARGFGGRWVVVRPGNVYGPGDEVVSLLLRMVRTLPAVPVIAGGDQPFQPVWTDDVGEALAVAVERADLAGRTLDVAGPERTTMHDLLDRLTRLTGRSPVRVPLPGPVASLGVKLADAVGIGLPINDSQLTMLAEGNVVDDPAANALDTVLGVAPTPLDEGLRRLLDVLPEQLPDEGVGELRRRRFWADVRGARLSPEALLQELCVHFHEVTPEQMDLEAEPGTPRAVLAEGQTVTMALPLRGNVQVRVAELTPRTLTLQTVEGHPLAGAVRFSADPHDGALRFEVCVVERAANVFDWVAMAALGSRLQKATWRDIVQAMVDASGGEAPDGVQHADETLDGEAAEREEARLHALADARRRAAHEAEVAGAEQGAGPRGATEG
ncbi:complex I NDUFA9 subunit family protein [Roseisolibacter sp. H3M3-2]|uniref:complex I NDUFA9 subunit family protein n=1 Tax=Roseisolibacter sp. H3M3-2 TaxID=3031323 RepID=UPI0023DA990F|nr:complex I NDUFA9 subunit family protein [Roseisolibacter sp. H3M3-2]MDF1502870.1 complex I NDUFA9 subunit family protein [Roseisolibacter sp. H3M3-2]